MAIFQLETFDFSILNAYQAHQSIYICVIKWSTTILMSVVQSQLRKLTNISYADKAPSIFFLYILELNALNIFFCM